MTGTQHSSARLMGACHLRISAHSSQSNVDLIPGLLAIVLIAAGWYWMDALIAVVIAIYILHGAWQILRDAANFLMDNALSTASRTPIQMLFLKHDAVYGLHDLHTRQVGLRVSI